MMPTAGKFSVLVPVTVSFPRKSWSTMMWQLLTCHRWVRLMALLLGGHVRLGIGCIWSLQCWNIHTFTYHVLTCSVPTHWQGCSKAGLKKGMLDPRSSLCKDFFRIWASSKSLIHGCNKIRSSQVFYLNLSQCYVLATLLSNHDLWSRNYWLNVSVSDFLFHFNRKFAKEVPHIGECFQHPQRWPVWDVRLFDEGPNQ